MAGNAGIFLPIKTGKFSVPCAGPRCAIGRTPDSCQGSWVRYPVWQHTFVSPSAFSRRAVVSYWRKYVHEVLVNRLGGLSLPRKSVVRSTDRPDMTLDVYRGRKTTIQQQQQQICTLVNPLKPNGFLHSYYLEKSILYFRGVRLIFSSLI